MLRLLVIVTCLIQWSLTQMVFLGSCPSLETVEHFDVKRYAGIWYENRKNRRYLFTMDSSLKCVSETYDLQPDGSIEITYKGTQLLGGKPHQHKGLARLVSPSTGKMKFTFSGLSFSPSSIPAWILATDYTSYSVVWSCSPAGWMNTQTAWILTREPVADQVTIRKALDVLEQSGINSRTLLVTDQRNCGSKSKSKT